MKNIKGGTIKPPDSIRLDACTLCQLHCPLCSGPRGKQGSFLGQGYLRSEVFDALMGKNPYIRRVELANQGEVFLNRDLPGILQSAHEKNIITTINGGCNLNHASDEALETLVKFETTLVRCSIDGVTQETYSKYRVGGKLKNVVKNIQKLNFYKDIYRSSKPYLIWQFIVFGHNEHEIERAALLAKMLRMKFTLRLNKNPCYMPVKDRNRLRKIIGYADRNEYLEKLKKSYTRNACIALWKIPQINWDGKLLGCGCNTWGYYEENVFKKDLMGCLNNDKMRYARQMLMGNKPPSDYIPCVQCHVFKAVKDYGNWITKAEINTYMFEYE